ncbi:4667_t:CDS:2, partial [Scutellospora calospora]
LYISISFPSRPFADWTLPEVCQLYGLCDIEDDVSLDLISELKFCLKTASMHSNEASKSHYTIKTSKTASITEVKYQDFEKGVAQNAVQIESVLTNRKRKAEEMEEKPTDLNIEVQSVKRQKKSEQDNNL